MLNCTSPYFNLPILVPNSALQPIRESDMISSHPIYQFVGTIQEPLAQQLSVRIVILSDTYIIVIVVGLGV